jgi:DNA-binding transcriptional MerR regulator
MTADSAVATDEELTIDELAARTGLTVRTLRFYASEGLVPPPVKRGRIAYYGAVHRMRLELVKSLQDHGYTLAAIEKVLGRIPFDAAPAQYAVQSAVLAPWLPDDTEAIGHDALERRAGRRLDADELAYLEQSGALERVGPDSFRASPAALGYALDLMRLPVPTSILQNSARIIDEHATAVANGLTDLFSDAVWGPYQRGEIDHAQVVAMLEGLRPLAVQGLVNAFGRAADRAARRGLEPS